MTRYTQIYSDYTSRLTEVSLLRKKASALERSSRSLLHGPEISALCRASVVLLSSHVEAYVKELGEHTLDAAHQQSIPRAKAAPQFFYYVSKEKIESIRNSTQPDAIARSVQAFVDSDILHWQSTGLLHGPISSTAFNSGFSNPKSEKVRSYFGRFGYTDFRRDFMRALGRKGIIIEQGLDLIVNTRNAIAHGDSSATKTPSEVKEMEDNAKIFCRTVDQIFSSWCRAYFCRIR